MHALAHTRAYTGAYTRAHRHKARTLAGNENIVITHVHALAYAYTH